MTRHDAQTRRRNAGILTICGIVGLLFMSEHSAFADEAENNLVVRMQTEQGHEIAQTWCSNCHVIEANGEGSIVTEAPTFQELAGRENQSDATLRAFLNKPHEPMPPLSLAREEIDGLIAYILSLAPAPQD